MFYCLHRAGIDKVYLHELVSLRDIFPSKDFPNNAFVFRPNTYNKQMGKADYIIGDIVRKYKGKGITDAFTRAGPRSTSHFEHHSVVAAIVTCGGLCPGLNNVIRELVYTLQYQYSIKKIIGIM